MSDLISRSALIEEFRKCHISFNGTPMEESDMMISYRSLARVINKQQTVQAKPVVHGEWVEYEVPHIICCSECDWGTSIDEKGFKFCPNCGADMRGGKND